MTSDWRDGTTRSAGGQRVLVATSLVLVVVDGASAGHRVEIDGAGSARVLAGTSPACELRLADREVSRRHASFDVTERGLRVTDLGSTNGTTVNGVAIGEAFVGPGAVVRLAGTTVRVESGGARPVSLAGAAGFGRMVGASEAMRRIYPVCARLAQAAVPVLVEGETGTGKELLAEALHEASPRAGAPFVVFDCTAVPPSLAESMLFGHERGAFTGAVAARKGVFEEADGGTLFVDEIGELDLQMQPKLLRALERGEVQRVGSNQWRRVDVRIVAATRRDLDREVQAGRFRDDLFFRLAVGRVELPPLRDRRGDVSLLAETFWRALGGADRPIPNDALERFEDYPWPGNVRELHNAVARLLALGEVSLGPGATALEQSLGGTPGTPPSAASGDVIDAVLAAELPLSRARERVVEEFERRYVERVCERHGGNVARAAAASGVARRYFQLLRARHRGS
ncbi:MAG TPA: sigma 54-interacting transcriptional regulator [Polyangiaceae bacterium]